MKGILFLDWKRKAILANPDREWQTRRLGGLKEINQEPDKWEFLGKNISISDDKLCFVFGRNDSSQMRGIKPRYHAGEVVYIKEACFIGGVPPDEWVVYKGEKGIDDSLMVWRNPRTMPAWAARYFRKILDVDVCRIRDISFEDCLAEGIVNSPQWQTIDYKAPEPLHPADLSNEEADKEIDRGWEAYTQQAFLKLWDSINPKFPWSSNCWVFKYTF